MSSETEVVKIHKFELAGLGKAPFKFVGMTENVFVIPGHVAKPGGSCDYCSTGIRYEFWCVSADEKRFKVGCDCIHKIGDAGLVKQISKAEKELRDKKNAERKVKEKEKLAKRIEAAKEKLPTIRGKLSEMPHPHEFLARDGKTMLDYVNWLFANHAEKKACEVIEKN